MFSNLKPPTNLEALLCNACRRALGIGISFIDQIRLYRSIIALAREVRLRSGGAAFDTASQTLSALLVAVSEHASALGLDPALPLPDGLLLERLAVQLSRAARKAAGCEPADRKIYKLPPDLRDDPPEQAIFAQQPMHREEPAEPEPAVAENPPQNPMQRETAADDGRLSAWRRDHKTDRDQRAHEKRRTVVEDRLYTKIKAMNQREQAERAAAA